MPVKLVTWRQISKICLVSCTLALFGCEGAAPPQAMFSSDSFVTGKIVSKNSVPIQLSLSHTIPHQTFKEVTQMPSGKLVATWKVEFTLSENRAEREGQISFLAQTYGMGHLPLGLQGNKLELRDFLRPSMQALLNTSFVHRERIERGLLGPSVLSRPAIIDNFVLSPTVKTLNNCWTTVYEVLRNDSSRFVSFFASDSAVQKYLGSGPNETAKDPANLSTPVSSFVKELSWQEACVPTEKHFCPDGNLARERNKDLVPGDYLLIYGKNGLEHAAIFLDQDVYFEKTGAKGDRYAYRLVPFSEISDAYKDPNLRYRFRRMKETAQLPHPLEAFDGRHNATEAAITDLLPEEYHKRHRVAHQPEVHDSRDIAIYEFIDFAIQAEGGRYRLQQ